MERNDNLRILGANLRALRKARGYSQEELAERANVHRNFIGFIERGERNVGIRTIIKLAQALDLHPSEVFADCAFVPELE